MENAKNKIKSCYVKIKAEGIGNSHLFEIQKNSYLGSSDSGRNPDSVPSGQEAKARGVHEKGRGSSSMMGRKASPRVQISQPRDTHSTEFTALKLNLSSHL